MRNLLTCSLVLLLLPAMSCTSLTWRGRQSGVTAAEAARGIKDVHTLIAEYETERFWTSVRQRRDGRVNAFGRDMRRIQNLIDRYFFNYSPTDPTVNYPTQESLLSHSAGFMAKLLAR